MKILIIEDSRLMQTAIKNALVKAGHEVTTANDGSEGLRIARSTQPGLILLDMMLPVMSGIEVLSALRAEQATAHTPVFVLTGLSQKNEEKLVEAGATRYFEKSESLLGPKLADLLAAIHECELRH